MDETPQEWLDRLFEFEFCPECGGDAADHEVCLVPGIGNYFARCLRAHGGAPSDDEPRTTLAEMRAAPGREACGG